MAKTHLDQIVDYPAKIIKAISDDNACVAFLVNKAFGDVIDNDKDKALDEFIYDHQYIDNTVEKTSAFLWVEMEVDSVENKQIKGVLVYITIACHKDYMKLDGSIYRGIMGNRRDNLVRYVDKLLNGKSFLGIGELSLKAMRTINPINKFTIRELTYSVPDFNILETIE